MIALQAEWLWATVGGFYRSLAHASSARAIVSIMSTDEAVGFLLISNCGRLPPSDTWKRFHARRGMEMKEVRQLHSVQPAMVLRI